jgi:hypothetical protein
MRRRLALLACLTVALVPAASFASSAQRVTIFARPTTVGWTEAALLYGTAIGASPQDVLKIELKECGSTIHRTLMEAHVLSGGGWSAPVAPGVTSSVRAVWKRSASASVTIRQEAWVSLERRRSGSGLLVSVTSKRSLWRRVVEIQRRSGGAWRTVKHVRLTDSVTSTGTVSASRATFALEVPSGTRLRAVLPQGEAKPCYVRSVSRVVSA